MVNINRTRKKAVNIELKAKARELRLQRLSIGKIAEMLNVTPSGVFNWVRDMPLTPEEKQAARARPIIERSIESRKEILANESKFHLAVKHKQLSVWDKANIAEAAILFRLALHGFHVYGSAFDNNVVDWFVSDGISTKRVQVKWLRRIKNCWPVLVVTHPIHRKKRVRYDENEMDFLVGYDLYSDTAYVYTREEVSHAMATISVKKEHAERWDKLFTTKTRALGNLHSGNADDFDSSDRGSIPRFPAIPGSFSGRTADSESANGCSIQPLGAIL